jgi:glycosyltransferase involved in cell wall biosynthesis
VRQTETLVSIITIVLNGDRHIEQTIKSVLEQSYSPIEYIVIDGGSTDGTLSIIDRYRDRIATFISEPDHGIYDAINKGISRANGKLIGLIHCGDYFEPDTVSVVLEKFLTTGADVICGDLRIIEEEGEANIVHIERCNYHKLNKQMSIFHPATFVSRKCYSQYGMYDVRYKSASDYDLFLRLFLSNVQFFQVNRVLANFRYGGISGQNYILSLKENYKIRVRNLGLISACSYLLKTVFIHYFYSLRKIVLTTIIGKKLFYLIKKYKYKYI